MNPVAITGLLVAAIRAEESTRAERLFEDPFAAALAGEEGRALLARYRGIGPAIPIIEVRTRWYDDGVARTFENGVRQFVILAAGMDARAYRLAWPDGSRVYEIDQPEVIAAKGRVLADAVPRCTRVAIGVNLADDWPERLAAEGFDRHAKTTWFVEGLLQYLERPAVERLFARIDDLSASGSVALYDVVGQTMLSSHLLTATKQTMVELGAPWLFGSDEPAALLASWNAVVTEPAVVGNAWKRWPFPPVPPNIPGIPRGYFVEATKS